MAQLETATLAGGCFWCTEAIFQRLNGVKQVVPGYAGGQTQKPSYDEVSSGESGHAEVIQLKFDPKVIGYDELLRIFFHLHDPTTLNRQGMDVGSQYRSAIFFHNKEQEKKVRQVLVDLASEFDEPIVTEVLPYVSFFPAESHHHNYFEKHQDAPYCQLVIAPKLKKLLNKYSDKVKAEFRDT